MSTFERSGEASTDGVVSDAEIWSRAIARCAKLERNTWIFGAGMGAAGLASASIGGDLGSLWSTAVLSFMHALIVRLDVHYWRVIGFDPVETYWRRVRELAPQFAAIGTAGGAAVLLSLEFRQLGPASDVVWGIAMLAGGLYGFALALGLAVKCDLAKARRWLE
jgi:hypothetical protein